MNSYLQKKIFITDDDPVWRLMLYEMLSHTGCTDIRLFEDGAGCIKHLHLKPAIVFLDYQMNEMDGLQVLQKIREQSPDTAVVFCSAYEKLTVAVEAMKNGSSDYIIKSKCSEEYLQSLLESLNEQAVLAERIY